VKSSDYFNTRLTPIAYSKNSWTVLNVIEQGIKTKIENIGIPLKDWDIKIYRGILTGYNEAFIIDKKTKDELILDSPKNAEIIRPILRGRDLTRYNYNFSDLWMIIAEFGSHRYLASDYPTIYNYLSQFEKRLKDRGQCRYTSSGRSNPDKEFPGQHHWLELDNNPTKEFLDFFSKPKIIWGEISDKSKFAYDESSYFTEATTFIMTGEKLKYLLSQLNSKLLEWYFNQIGTATGVGTNRWKKYTIEQLPVRIPTDEQLEFIENLVDSRINCIDEGEKIKIEKKIDELVYSLYELTEEEILFFS